MDELDRELGVYADSLRPDRQPSLDDVIAHGRARTRRTAVAASALAVVAVVGVAVAVVGGNDGTTTLPIATTAPTPSPTTTREPVYGCGEVRISGIVDYTNFVKANGLVMSSAETFGLQVTVREADLGQATDRVSCSLEEETHGTGSTEHINNGTSSFLPEGTTLSEVKGFDPRCRIAAVQDGRLVAFLASVPSATTHQPAPCAVMPGLSPTGSEKAPGDYRNAPAAYRDRSKLPDCGSLDLRDRALTVRRAELVAPVRACFRTARDAEFRLVELTIDAGPLYSVWRKHGDSVELWQSGGVGLTGQPPSYWHHYTCPDVEPLATGAGCQA
jgi:hypothetical protein